MKSDHQQRIEQFMLLAGQAVPDKPCIPSEEVRLLRAKLIFEEAMETIHALGVLVRPLGEVHAINNLRVVFETVTAIGQPLVPDLEQIADGCADISVVTIGTLSACGITDAALLAEVDASNLRKFGPGGYRRDDGKWMKPKDWEPPNILKAIGVEERRTLE